MNPSKKGNSGSGAQQLEDVPELLHKIQLRLPVKDAARTIVLSKSWLHAWSTIPTLRFHHAPRFCDEEHERRNPLKLVDINRTLMRYIGDNIPIQTFKLSIEIENQESACFAENWLRLLATKTRVKVISLTILFSQCGTSLNLPSEILASENLTKLRVFTGSRVWMTRSNHDPAPVIIKCVSLRVLHLNGLRISQEILDGILSCCSLLEEIKLSHCSQDLNTITVKNLPRLYELTIDTNDDSTDFVISHLPNLRIFSFDPCPCRFGHSKPRPFNAHLISLGSSVRKLSLGGGLIMDNTSLDLINSGFRFLWSLTLDMTSWMSGSFHFTCASPIKILSLRSCPSTLIDVRVHAPKLLFFEFRGKALPSTLLFPVSSLEQMVVRLNIKMPVDASFFLKMRETLALSRECVLHITTHNCSQQSLDMDMDDLRARLLLPPAGNVQQLWFGTKEDEGLWDRSPFFEAFFEICHPKYVSAKPDMEFKHNHFCKLMLREVLEKNKTGTAYWPHRLEHVQIREGRHQQWRTLTNSERSLIDGSAPAVYMYFKLHWC